MIIRQLGKLGELDGKIDAKIDKLDAKLDSLRIETDAKIEKLETKIDRLNARIHARVDDPQQEFRDSTHWIVGAIVGVAGAGAALASRLLRSTGSAP